MPGMLIPGGMPLFRGALPPPPPGPPLPTPGRLMGRGDRGRKEVGWAGGHDSSILVWSLSLVSTSVMAYNKIMNSTKKFC